MNKALQKWAERKQKTLKKWSKEYDKLCKAEGIKENPLVSFTLDRDYIASINAIIRKNDEEAEFICNTKALFLHEGKWS